MNIQTLTLGPLATNCYLVRAEESRSAVIIDPAANSKRLLAALEEQGLTLEAILLLRELDVPVARIRSFLDDRSAQSLAALWDEQLDAVDR